MRRRVGRQVRSRAVGQRSRSSAAPLIEQRCVVPGGVEDPPVSRTAAAAGTAVQPQRRYAVWRTDGLPVDLVSIAYCEHARVVRLDLRILLSHQTSTELGRDTTTVDVRAGRPNEPRPVWKKEGLCDSAPP